MIKRIGKERVFEMTEKVMEAVKKSRIIVVARGLEENDVIPFCEAVAEGGIRLVEIPYNQLSSTRLEDTAKRIAMIKKHFGDKLLVGAGTVLNTEEVAAAADADAEYILSPSFDESVVRYTKERGLASFPGIMTPTEAQNAHLCGADMVKVFPTGVLGIPYLKAVRVPLSHIGMIAMGGVNEENLGDFLKVCEAVGIGNGICNKELLKSGNFAEITRRAKAFTSQI